MTILPELSYLLSCPMQKTDINLFVIFLKLRSVNSHNQVGTEPQFNGILKTQIIIIGLDAFSNQRLIYMTSFGL